MRWRRCLCRGLRANAHRRHKTILRSHPKSHIGFGSESRVRSRIKDPELVEGLISEVKISMVIRNP